MYNKKVSHFKPYTVPVKITEENTIREMVERVLQYPRNHHLYVVDNDGILTGLISRKRLFRSVFSHNVAADSRIHELYTLLTSENAGDLLARDIFTVKEKDDMNKALTLLMQKDLFELPVVDDENHLLGILTEENILQEWLKAQDAY